MKIFTIIKDRSERVKDKNFRLLGGIPLWEHLIIELAQFDVTINTDSERLLLQLKDKNFKNVSVVKRKKEHIEWENDPTNLTSPVQAMLLTFVKT